MATRTAAAVAGARTVHVLRGDEKKVIFASSLGTVFEWYDFYLYGSLAAIIARPFFSKLDPTSATSSRCSPSRRASWCARSRHNVRPAAWAP